MDYINNNSEEKIEDIKFVKNSNAIAVKINGSYKEGMGTFEIYECTRSSWAIDKTKRDLIEYVLAVFKGEIKEVFKVSGWFDAGLTLSSIKRTKIEKRSEFVGCLAEDEIREKYIGKTIEDLIGKTFNEFNYMIIK